MSFVEIDLFGVYVAPASLLVITAWLLTMGLRRIASRLGLLQLVWHPSLFVFAVHVIVLASLTLLVAY